MKLKYLLIYLIFLFSGANIAFGQKEEIEDPYRSETEVKAAKVFVNIADRYFENFEYYLAAQEYLKAVQEDREYIYALYFLAESYRLYFNYDRAQKYYALVLQKDKSAYPLARYWYANMLKNRGEYEKALENFESFLTEYPDSEPYAAKLKEKARIDADGCLLAMNELKKPVRNFNFHGLQSPLNTGASEYAPVIYKNDTNIVITSARPGTVGDKDFNVLGGKFSDLFRFEKGNDSTWTPYVAEDKFQDLNTTYNDGSGSFTKDKKKFYFTRADEKFVTADYIDYLPAIYVTKFEKGKWSKPERLNENINMKGQYNAEPSISPNGDTLFFVSKRPGGKGMHDIYYSLNTGGDKEEWSEAINLSIVNTPFIEKSPCYYAKEATLFFSTNGREGFGGLDIFKAVSSDFSTISNLGLPFNSNMDDFYFVLGEDKGYLASNREGGEGNDDIYFFNIVSSEAIIAEVNKDSLMAEIVKDTLYEIAHNVSQSEIENSKEFSLAVDSVYNGREVSVETSYLITDKDSNNDGKTDIKSISIVGTVLYNDTHEPAVDVQNKLKDKEGRVLKTTKTNQEGNFRFDNLPIEDYKVEIEDEDPRLTNEIKYIVENVKVKTSDQEVSRKLFENIYFGFDKYNLKSSAKKVLKELAEFYRQNPEIQIEMSANTDSYGSSEYNQYLSKQRGNAALDYLIKQGVDRSALVVNALGEEHPWMPNDNAAGRQLNRRVEFHIVGGPGYDAQAMTYIADPNASLEQIAATFNMTVDELKEMNGIVNERLEAYQPLRVRRTGDADIIAPITLSLIRSAPADSITGAETQNPSGRFALRQANPENYKRRATLKEGEEFFIVAPKNTLFSISRLFGMTVEELKELNGLRGNRILIGQRLKVKISYSEDQLQNWQYVVKEGDSMASIAQKFNLTIDELIEINRLGGYKLYEYMILKVR